MPKFVDRDEPQQIGEGRAVLQKGYARDEPSQRKGNPINRTRRKPSRGDRKNLPESPQEETQYPREPRERMGERAKAEPAARKEAPGGLHRKVTHQLTPRASETPRHAINSPPQNNPLSLGKTVILWPP